MRTIRVRSRTSEQLYPERVHRLRPSRRAWVAFDVVVAAGMMVFSVWAIHQPWSDGFRVAEPGWLDTTAVATLVAPFALRTVDPVWALGLSLAGQLVAVAIGPHDLLFYSGFVPLLVLVYAVARHDDGWPGRATPLLVVPAVMLSQVRDPSTRTVVEWVFTLVMVGAVWASGRLARRLALQGEALEVALTRLRLEQDAGERAAVELERTRIATEMHDVVGHALSLMVLQTGAARAELAAGDASPAAQDQLHAAEAAGRSALDELRRTLGLLRRIPPPVGADTSPR